MRDASLPCRSEVLFNIVSFHVESDETILYKVFDGFKRFLSYNVGGTEGGSIHRRGREEGQERRGEGERRGEVNGTTSICILKVFD